MCNPFENLDWDSYHIETFFSLPLMKGVVKLSPVQLLEDLPDFLFSLTHSWSRWLKAGNKKPSWCSRKIRTSLPSPVYSKGWVFSCMQTTSLLSFVFIYLKETCSKCSNYLSNYQNSWAILNSGGGRKSKSCRWKDKFVCEVAMCWMSLHVLPN